MPLIETYEVDVAGRTIYMKETHVRHECANMRKAWRRMVMVVVCEL